MITVNKRVNRCRAEDAQVKRSYVTGNDNFLLEVIFEGKDWRGKIKSERSSTNIIQPSG